MQNKVRCADCRCVNKEECKCGLTGRPVKLESIRNCKKFGKSEKIK